MEVLSFIKDYWMPLTFICSIVAGLIIQVINIREGIKAILHDRIIQKCEYIIRRGNVTADDLEELEYLNKPYKALGGNGTVEVMLREVHKLPKREREV